MAKTKFLFRFEQQKQILNTAYNSHDMWKNVVWAWLHNYKTTMYEYELCNTKKIFLGHNLGSCFRIKQSENNLNWWE